MAALRGCGVARWRLRGRRGGARGGAGGRARTGPRGPAEDWARGLSASLRAGIAAIDAELAVISVVDTPDVGADVVRRVLAAASATGLARAVYGGRPGHPVVIARRFWPQLLAALHGDTGAAPFLRGRADVVEVECGDLATGLDIDQR